MAIILAKGRPAIDIIQGGWAYLRELGPRTILQSAIAAVGRYAFVVGDNLLLTMFHKVFKDENGDYFVHPFFHIALIDLDDLPAGARR